MDAQYLNDLFTIIKSDNVKKFGEVITDRLLSLCLGRFPILSLCYIYDSYSILSKYEKRLKQIKTENLIVDDEPVDIYFDFRKVASKSLRLYTSGALVSPVEALALKGKSEKINAEWSEFDKNATIIANVKKIYLINYQTEVSIDTEKANLPKIKNKNKANSSLIKFIVAISCFVLLISFSIGFLSGIIGVGTTGSPFRVDSIEKIVKNQNNSLLLTKDIYVADQVLDSLYSLDGNGKTVYLSNPIFIKSLKKSIRNVTFVISGEFVADDDNYALIQVNDGIVENVTVDIRYDVEEKESENDTYISALVGTNNGTVSNSKIIGNATIVGNALGNAYFAWFSSVNNGDIINCVADCDSVISENVDLSGIASDNYGNITDSINNCDLRQDSSIVFGSENARAWNPNVAGITMNNNGKIQNCVNNGEITATVGSDQKYQILLGGIAVNNLGNIVASTNNGAIYAESINCSIYAGGIVTMNKQGYDVNLSNFVVGSVENCRNYGDSDLTSSGSSAPELLAGGIAGYNQGNILRSFNSAVQSVKVVSAVSLVAGISAFNTSFSENSYTSYGTISECRSDTEIVIDLGSAQSFIGGLVANNSCFLTQSFAFCDFTITDNSINDEQTLKTFVGSITGVDVLTVDYASSKYTTYTSNNYGYYKDDSVNTVGSFVVNNSIVNIDDALNHKFTDKQTMINELKKQGRYWE